jgi:hypothetical protein
MHDPGRSRVRAAVTADHEATGALAQPPPTDVWRTSRAHARAAAALGVSLTAVRGRARTLPRTVHRADPRREMGCRRRQRMGAAVPPRSTRPTRPPMPSVRGLPPRSLGVLFAPCADQVKCDTCLQTFWAVGAPRRHLPRPRPRRRRRPSPCRWTTSRPFSAAAAAAASAVRLVEEEDTLRKTDHGEGDTGGASSPAVGRVHKGGVATSTPAASAKPPVRPVWDGLDLLDAPVLAPLAAAAAAPNVMMTTTTTTTAMTTTTMAPAAALGDDWTFEMTAAPVAAPATPLVSTTAGLPAALLLRPGVRSLAPLSPAAQRFVDGLPDLSFMNARLVAFAAVP